MEVFNPSLGTWELLPNPPPFVITPHINIVTALLESKKQILVASLFPSSSHNCFFFVYNVEDRCWTTLEVPIVLELHGLGGSPSKYKNVVAAGSPSNVLYWILFDNWNPKELVMHAYDLDKGVWSEGRLQIRECIVEKDDHTYDIY